MGCYKISQKRITSKFNSGKQIHVHEYKELVFSAHEEHKIWELGKNYTWFSKTFIFLDYLYA